MLHLTASANSKIIPCCLSDGLKTIRLASCSVRSARESITLLLDCSGDDCVPSHNVAVDIGFYIIEGSPLNRIGKV